MTYAGVACPEVPTVTPLVTYIVRLTVIQIITHATVLNSPLTRSLNKWLFGVDMCVMYLVDACKLKRRHEPMFNSRRE